jgi:hypothetical protein
MIIFDDLLEKYDLVDLVLKFILIEVLYIDLKIGTYERMIDI